MFEKKGKKIWRKEQRPNYLSVGSREKGGERERKRQKEREMEGLLGGSLFLSVCAFFSGLSPPAEPQPVSLHNGPPSSPRQNQYGRLRGFWNRTPLNPSLPPEFGRQKPSLARSLADGGWHRASDEEARPIGCDEGDEGRVSSSFFFSCIETRRDWEGEEGRKEGRKEGRRKTNLGLESEDHQSEAFLFFFFFSCLRRRLRRLFCTVVEILALSLWLGLEIEEEEPINKNISEEDRGELLHTLDSPLLCNLRREG